MDTLYVLTCVECTRATTDQISSVRLSHAYHSTTQHWKGTMITIPFTLFIYIYNFCYKANELSAQYRYEILVIINNYLNAARGTHDYIG